MARDKGEIRKMIEELKKLNTSNMYLNDFFHTWKESDDEIAAVFKVAEILRGMRENNISAKVFDSGLGISIFRDNSTRTRFSFASACNLLGLEVQDLDEKVSQIAHGETVRETANMISFMADVIGIRDDMYIGKGYTYMKSVSEAVQEGYRDGVLEQRPTLVNLQCDIDHPTQCMADLLHVINHFGGVEHLKGKKVAMTWAYSPSYGKPLSVPQGVIGLFTRFGMDVVLAHPEGYDVMSDVEEVAKEKTLALKKVLKENSREMNGVNVITVTAPTNPSMLKNAAMMLQKETENFVIAGAFEFEGKPQLLLMYSQDLVAKGHNATRDIKEAARLILGGGGGQPGLATAGGKETSGLADALETMINMATKGN